MTSVSDGPAGEQAPLAHVSTASARLRKRTHVGGARAARAP